MSSAQVRAPNSHGDDRSKQTSPGRGSRARQRDQRVNVLLPIFTSDILPVFVIAGVGFILARYVDASVTTVVTTILALEFDVAPAFVTSAVFVTTVLSPFTLTPLTAYLR